MASEINWNKFGIKNRREFYKALELFLGEDFADMAYALDASDKIDFETCYEHITKNWKWIQDDLR